MLWIGLEIFAPRCYNCSWYFGTICRAEKEHKMDLNFHLEAFEGPMDLLLHLIEKNKIDIYDIPIAEITDQYLAYIDEMKKADLGIMSEFLVMAATLLDIKSRYLLPHEENEEGEEEDPRLELVQQLLEYKMYKSMSYVLRDRQVDAERIFYKIPTIPKEVKDYEEPIDLEALVGDMNLTRLNEIFSSVIRRQADKVDPVRSKFGRIEKEEVSLEDTIAFLEDYARHHLRFSFRDLLESRRTKMQIIVMFLAILEFMKIGKISISQEEIFDDICIESKLAA